MDKSTVIVLGLSPTGLYAVRESVRAGAEVVGVSDGFACGCYSRYLRNADRCWKISSQDELLNKLMDFASVANRRPILLPTSDRYIEFIGRHADTLSGSFLFAESYRNLSQELMDKRSFNKLCHEYGIATPGVWEAADKNELLALSLEIPFPCILKPELIHCAANFLKGKKVLLARSKDEYCSLVRSIPEETGGWLVQEVIPGPESNITLFGGYFGRDGQALQTFTARKLRQYPAGFGSASLVRSELCHETLEKSVDFLGKIGFRGICGTEFKRDSRDGKLKIIEINPRPTLWFQITHAAGKRIVETACRDLAGLPVSKENNQIDGVVWRYIFKDIYSSLYYRLKGKTFIFPKPDVSSGFATPNQRIWPVYDSADPLPALAEPCQFLNKLVRRFHR